MSTEEECVQAVTQCTLMARLMLGLDVPGVLQEADKFDAFGCFFEPTAWKAKRKETKEVQELMEAALPLWRWAQRKKRELELADVA